MVTVYQVIEAMKGWAIRFKDRAPTPLEMTILAEEYHQDLVSERVSSEVFHEISKIIRKRNKFFPKMAEILEYQEEAERDMRQQLRWERSKNQRIEHTEIPRSRDFGLLCIKNINLMLKGKITQDEAVRRNTPTYGQGGDINLVEYEDHKGVDGSVVGGLANGMSFER